MKLILGVVLLALLWSCTPKDEVKEVFVVFSYHPEFSWVISENEGLDEVFSDKKVTIEKFYMDTKRKTSQDWKKKISEDAIAKIEATNPDILIVFDDNACEWVAKHFANTDLPVVFAGMNNEPSDYGFPAKNIAGVVERIPFHDIISFLKQLKPDVQKVAFISDESPTSKGIKDLLSNMKLQVNVTEFFTTNDFNQWKSKILDWQDQVDAIGVITFNTLTDPETEESLFPGKVIEWTIANNKLPDFASFEFGVKYGLLCGATSPANIQSKTAAEIALKILDGANPEDLKIINPPNVTRLINTKRAQQLEIKIPEGEVYVKIGD